MATFADKLALLITADSTQAVSELRKVGASAETNLSKADLAGGGLSATLGGIGAVASAAGAGLAVFGAIAVRTAEEGQTAHTRLEVAIANVGQTTEQWTPKIQAASDHMAKLGFNNVEVESSIARLIPATHSVAEAISQQGLVADVARGRNISLADATQAVVQADAGRYRQLVANGILTANQVKGFHDQKDAIDALTKTYGGEAHAFSLTLAGDFATLAAESHNLAQKVGNDLAPAVSVGVQALTGLLSLAEKAGSAVGSIQSHLPDPFSHTGLEGSGSSGFDAVTKSQISDVANAQRDYAEAVAISGKNSREAAQALVTLQVAQRELAPTVKALNAANQDYATASASATTAAQKMSAAQQALNNDLSAGDTSNLGQDYKDLAASTLQAAEVQLQITSAERAAQAQADITAGAVISLADAYQILGQSQVQDNLTSIGNFNTAASASFDASQKAAGGLDAFGQALDGLTKKSGSGGAGGATKNLTAAFYDQIQKAEALRDAIKSVADDQFNLQKAEADQTQALADAATAAQDYADALHGVSAASQKGKDAKTTVASTKDAAITSGLDVNDAQRALAKSIKETGANSEQTKRAEVALREAQRANTDAVKAYHDAQYQLNGTLHGFAANSPEVIQAQKNLTDANNKAHDATIAVRDATDALHDAQINAQKSSDDLQGKLNSLSTSGAGKQMDDLTTKINNVKSAGLTLAQEISQNVVAAGGTLAEGLSQEIQTLDDIVSAVPALKGAYDTVLRNLAAQIKAQTPATNAAQTGQFGVLGGGLAGAADGGVFTGPKTGYLMKLHGTEEVLPTGKKVGQSSPRVSGYAQTTNQYTINVYTLDGNSPKSVDAIRDAVKQWESRKGYIEVRTKTPA